MTYGGLEFKPSTLSLASTLLAPAGHLVSSFIEQHLPQHLAQQLSTEADLHKVMREGFLQTDAALSASGIDCELSGSTCVVAQLQVGEGVSNMCDVE